MLSIWYLGDREGNMLSAVMIKLTTKSRYALLLALTSHLAKESRYYWLLVARNWKQVCRPATNGLRAEDLHLQPNTRLAKASRCSGYIASTLNGIDMDDKPRYSGTRKCTFIYDYQRKDKVYLKCIHVLFICKEFPHTGIG